jgi:hypothetical protein
MAEHEFLVGGLDLSEFLKVHPEDGFDPFDPDFNEPQFGQNPITDGGVLVNDVRGLKEGVWPLALLSDPDDAGSPADQINEFRREINLELAGDGILVRWQEPGATDTTHWDLVKGRLEPANNYFRQIHGWADHVLRLWVQPHGHTATYRTLATGVGSGAVRVAIPSVAGDTPAYLQARIRIASVAGVPMEDGRHVVLSALPHPSWLPLWEAASIGVGGAASRVAATAAIGSQAISNTSNRAPVGTIPLAPASVYSGRRIRAMLVSNGGIYKLRDVHSGRDLTSRHWAIATSTGRYSLTDMGSFTLPDTGAATYVLAIEPVNTEARPFDLSGGEVAALLVLPEDDTSLIVDRANTGVTLDRYVNVRAAAAGYAGTYTNLLGTTDETGVVYDLPESYALGTYPLYFNPNTDVFNTLGMAPWSGGSQTVNRFALALPGVPSSPDWKLETYFNMQSGFQATRTIGLALDAAATYSREAAISPISDAHFVGAEIKQTGSTTSLSILRVIGNATAVLASRALATAVIGPNRLMTLNQKQDRIWATISGLTPPNGSGFASVGLVATDPAMVPVMAEAFPVVYAHCSGAASGVAAVAPVAFRSFRSALVPSQAIDQGDQYVVSASGTERWSSASQYRGRVEGRMQGVMPTLQPGQSAFFALAIPTEGPANVPVDIEIAARERFTFLR